MTDNNSHPLLTSQKLMSAINIVSASATAPTVSPSAAVSSSSPTSSYLSHIIHCAALCNNAVFENSVSGEPLRVVGCNGTNKTLLSWTLSLVGAAEMPLWLRVLSFPFSLHPISPLPPLTHPTLPIALCLRTLSPLPPSNCRPFPSRQTRHKARLPWSSRGPRT